MRVWRIVPDSDIYDSLLLQNVEDWEVIEHISRQRRPTRTWYPLPVEIVPAERTGDFPSLAIFAPVFSENALQHLRPILGYDVELLPFDVGDSTRPLYLVNVLPTVDCLDHSRSRFKRLKSGKILYIEHYVFQEDRLGGHSIFKLPEDNEVYVSDTFKGCVEQHGLEGLLFKQVWPQKGPSRI